MDVNTNVQESSKKYEIIILHTSLMQPDGLQDVRHKQAVNDESWCILSTETRWVLLSGSI